MPIGPRTILLVWLSWCTIQSGISQSYEVKLVDVIYGNAGNSTRLPERSFIQPDTGSIMFSVSMNESCQSYYSFVYHFNEDFDKRSLQPGDTLSGSVLVELKPLGSPCYEFTNENFRNPFVSFRPGHEVDYSGLIAKNRNEGTWIYEKPIAVFQSSFPYVYAYNYPVGVNTGRYTGYYKMAVPHSLEGKKHTFLQLKLSGTSPLGCTDCNFYFEVLFVFQLEKKTTTDPCNITKPDCSCCPGTIPVWNFNLNVAECICPEGMRWDKLKNRCVGEN